MIIDNYERMRRGYYTPTKPKQSDFKDFNEYWEKHLEYEYFKLLKYEDRRWESLNEDKLLRNRELSSRRNR